MGVDINEHHIPLLPCTKPEKSKPTLPARSKGRNLNGKRADPVLLSVSVSGQSFKTIATASVNVPLIAIDSAIPRFPSTSSSMRKITLKGIPTTFKKKATKTHTHHRASITRHPLPTIIIDPIPTFKKPPKTTHKPHLPLPTTIFDPFPISTKPSKVTISHHTPSPIIEPIPLIEGPLGTTPTPHLPTKMLEPTLLSLSTKLPKTIQIHLLTSKSLKPTQLPSIHPHPLPIQTLTDRWETKTKSFLPTRTKSSNSIITSFSWISLPQTRFPLLPLGAEPIKTSTTLVTKASSTRSTGRATWHPPAETLWPPIPLETM